MHGTNAYRGGEQGVCNAQRHEPQQVYDHVLAHTADGVTQHFLVRNVIAPAGLVPMGGDVRPNEGHRVFEFGNAVAAFLLKSTCHNLPL